MGLVSDNLKRTTSQILGTPKGGTHHLHRRSAWPTQRRPTEGLLSGNSDNPKADNKPSDLELTSARAGTRPGPSPQPIPNQATIADAATATATCIASTTSHPNTHTAIREPCTSPPPVSEATAFAALIYWVANSDE